ncbi:hypothetical protein [Spiroplasma alleghenense]|uniref:Lipoprotein n=1 Tax=Spiroplasma alleghenense TaxID=216931 RepID=A0A345Z516_9MOLU|nr:hypothetical protein [Spiroplasma alleghenense]AXK51695.1 hypothetical protein SALLE_v1c10250 [Spiroplasma alleghenense]
MKKILALLGSLAIMSTTSLVVACNTVDYSKKITGDNLTKAFENIEPSEYKTTSLLIKALIEQLDNNSLAPKPENGKEGYEIKVLNNQNKVVEAQNFDDIGKHRFVIVTYNLLETVENDKVNEVASFSIVNKE